MQFICLFNRLFSTTGNIAYLLLTESGFFQFKKYINFLTGTQRPTGFALGSWYISTILNFESTKYLFTPNENREVLVYEVSLNC